MNKASAFDMNALDSRIRELVAYARARDGEERTALFRNLVDLFLTGKAPTKNPTRSQLLDVLEALVPHVDVDSRRTVADLVANMSEPPIDLGLRLCRDRASLVTNLLTTLPFDEDDIIDLIERTGREHHQILAAREDLSANVWIALARAAPTAPPFDHQSTLALWSEDLGILRTSDTRTSDIATTQTATVTPLHSGKPRVDQNITSQTSAKQRVIGKPSIRIIKTDEDLMAERAQEQKPADTQALLNEQKPSFQPPADASIENSAPLDPALKQFVNDEFSNRALKDPGPGGWAWQSDRDALIVRISPQGKGFLGENIETANASILDILGLNEKLGHPVTRAFQRRSAIHDAPIFLSNFEKPHRHWTLEATPFFNSANGTFEGYEGVLTPVIRGTNESPHEGNRDEGNAIFLDDNHPSSVADTHAKPFKRPQEPLVATANHTNAVAASAIQSAVNEALEPITAAIISSNSNTAEKIAPQETAAYTPTQQAKTNTKPELATKTESHDTTAIETAELMATLDLLDETLSKLTQAGKTSGDISCRLQSEIAAACARTLRDQLTK